MTSVLKRVAHHIGSRSHTIEPCINVLLFFVSPCAWVFSPCSRQRAAQCVPWSRCRVCVSPAPGWWHARSRLCQVSMFGAVGRRPQRRLTRAPACAHTRAASCVLATTGPPSPSAAGCSRSGPYRLPRHTTQSSSCSTCCTTLLVGKRCCGCVAACGVCTAPAGDACGYGCTRSLESALRLTHHAHKRLPTEHGRLPTPTCLPALGCVCWGPRLGVCVLVVCRDFGENLTFLTLRDAYGVVQVTVVRAGPAHAGTLGRLAGSGVLPMAATAAQPVALPSRRQCTPTNSCTLSTCVPWQCCHLQPTTRKSVTARCVQPTTRKSVTARCVQHLPACFLNAVPVFAMPWDIHRQGGDQVDCTQASICA